MPTKRKRTEVDFSDPYRLLDSPLFPGYAEHLRQLGAFDGLDDDDARQVVGVIMCNQMDIRWRYGLMRTWMGGGPQDPRDARVALQQHAANIGTGCDVRQWHDRSAASRALGIAADALNIVGADPSL